MEVLLIGTDEATAGQRFVVDRQEVTIGRGSEATIRIGDPEVSRRHCVASQINGILLVRDLGSTNGTFLNGKMISEAILKPGDRLTIGKSSFIVHYESNPAKPPGRLQPLRLLMG